MQKCIYATPFPQPLSVLWMDSSLDFCIACFGEFFCFKQDYFFPFPGGPLSPPFRKPNEQSICLNSYRFSFYTEQQEECCAFSGAELNFPPEPYVCKADLLSPSVDLKGNEQEMWQLPSFSYRQVQQDIFVTTTALKTALHFQSSKPKLPGDFQLRH